MIQSLMSQGKGEICLAEQDAGHFSWEEGTAKRLPGQGESKPTLPLRRDPAENRGAGWTGSPRRAERPCPTSGPGNGFHAKCSRSDAVQISRRAAGPAVGGARLRCKGLYLAVEAKSPDLFPGGVRGRGHRSASHVLRDPQRRQEGKAWRLVS